MSVEFFKQYLQNQEMFWSVTARNKKQKNKFKILHLCIYKQHNFNFFIRRNCKVSAFLLIAVIYISSFFSSNYKYCKYITKGING